MTNLLDSFNAVLKAYEDYTTQSSWYIFSENPYKVKLDTTINDNKKQIEENIVCLANYVTLTNAMSKKSIEDKSKIVTLEEELRKMKEENSKLTELYNTRWVRTVLSDDTKKVVNKKELKVEKNLQK